MGSIRLGRRTWLRWFRDPSRSATTWNVTLVRNRRKPIGP